MSYYIYCKSLYWYQPLFISSARISGQKFL